jgi:hypothetical protein
LKLNILCPLILLCFCYSGLAQDLTQTVKGKITDGDTQVGLIGLTVLLLDSDQLIGASTDIDGYFEIKNVPIGRRSFKVSFIGYEDIFLNEIVVTSAREVSLNVQMYESIEELEALVIVAEDDQYEPLNTMTSISAHQLTVESTSRIAAGINDPGRTIQSYAGVSSVDDENNEIVVRGNSPRGMLWRMEGIEIPNPNHFTNGEGGTGGGVSALSTTVLDNSDFLTSAFPAEYGNALSSVFDLRLRNGNYTTREYTFQLGVLGIQAGLEGPISREQGSSYLLNYRYSTTSLLNQAGFKIGDSDVFPQWQDLSYNFNFPTKKIGRINVWGIMGASSAADVAEQDSSLWQYRSDIFQEEENHALNVVGITHNYLFSDNNSYLTTTTAYATTQSTVEEDTLDYDYVAHTIDEEHFLYKTLNVSSYYNRKINPRHVLRVGAIYTLQSYDLDVLNLNYDLGRREYLIDQHGHMSRYQGYVAWKWRPSKSLDWNAGIHVMRLGINGDTSIEPRLGAKWRVTPKSTLNAGLGLHSKAEPASIYLATDQSSTVSTQPNQNLAMTRAFHAVVGYSRVFAGDIHFKSEVYYQYLYDVPVKPNDTTHTLSAVNFSSGFTNEKFVNEGTARNYGIELTLEKAFSNNYYFLVTTSLFESKYTMPDGIERNTLFNSRYIYNVTGGKEFVVGNNNVLSLNVRSMLRGGYRTVPIDLAQSRQLGEEVRLYDQAFETKAPDYFRIDFGASYRRNKPNWSWIVSLNLQNATNRSNIWDQYYNTESGKLENINLVGLLPVLNYKVEF